MNEVVPRKWAAIDANEKLICIETYSGYRRSAADPAGKQFVMDWPAEPAAIGQALHEALAASRMLKPEEFATFFDRDAGEQRYESWVAMLQQRFAYASRRTLFKNMNYCDVECLDGVITIRPWFHEELEGWTGEGIPKTDHVVVKEETPAKELGEAVLLALSRCTGN
jgi:CDI immunity protein